MIPQLIYLGITFISVGISLSNAGKGNNDLITALITIIIRYTLLITGDFFDCLLK